jgi:hypothetical protein
MTKKNLLLILFAVALAGAYAIWFTDWLRPQTVKIFHTLRNNLRVLPPRTRANNPALMPSLIFGVTRQLRLTEIKVVPVAALETNKNPLPLWHLVSNSNSVPVKTFFYGQNIGGMKPALKGVRPEPLATNVTYRLFVTAGKIRGEHDFEIK